MSLPNQEARALAEAFAFLCDLSSGAEKRIPSATRERARRVLNHYPLDVEQRWLETTQHRSDSAEGAKPIETAVDVARAIGALPNGVS